MTNDTAVFEAMHPDPDGGEKDWIGRLGRREAIKRDGLEVDASSLAYCPHEWINDAGYVDFNLVRKFPLFLAHSIHCDARPNGRRTLEQRSRDQAALGQSR